MKPSMAAVMIALLVLGAQDGPADLERLIRDLGSEDVETRERASGEILRHLKTWESSLKEALARATDPEVQSRLRTILGESDPWFKDRLIAALPEGTDFNYVRFSPDGHTVAYAVVRDGKKVPVIGDYEGEGISPTCGFSFQFSGDGRRWAHTRDQGPFYVVIDGKRSEEYFSTGVPVFTHDGSVVAYSAGVGKVPCGTNGYIPKSYYVIVNGEKSEEFMQVAGPVLNPQGTKIAYCATTMDRKEHVVLDGKKGETFERIEGFRFTPDGAALAYKANVGGSWGNSGFRGGKWMFVVAGRKGPPFDEIGTYFSGICFTAEGKLLYKAREAKTWCVVCGDRRGEAFDEVGEPVQDRDQTQFAYAAKRAGQWRVVLDGREGEPFDDVGPVVFNPRGKGLAFAASRGGKWFVVADGKQGESFDKVGAPVFNAMGSEIAYVAVDGKKELVIVGDAKGSPFDAIDGDVHFMRDGKTVAYAANNGRRIEGTCMPFVADQGKSYVVIADKTVGPFKGHVEMTPSPDGRTVVCRDDQEYREQWFIGDRALPNFDHVYWPRAIFSPDGARVAFRVRIGLEIWWKVFDVTP